LLILPPAWTTTKTNFDAAQQRAVDAYGTELLPTALGGEWTRGQPGVPWPDQYAPELFDHPIMPLVLLGCQPALAQALVYGRQLIDCFVDFLHYGFKCVLRLSRVIAAERRIVIGYAGWVVAEGCPLLLRMSRAHRR
jgi:hypothetical protein